MAKQNIKEELAKKAGAIKGEQPKEQVQTPELEKQVQISESDSDAMIISDSDKRAIRLLRADEIECRVSTINEKGLSLFLFKDARVDQRILDETFTPFGWKRTHQCIDGNLYCTVEIWDEEKGQWIAKQDVGTTSYSEKEKGQASDSFKRACFNWGLGRELYTAPFIWVPATKVNIQRQGDRYTTTNKFFVHSIGYNHQREISALVIINQNGQKVFELKQKPGKNKDRNQKIKIEKRRKIVRDQRKRNGHRRIRRGKQKKRKKNRKKAQKRRRSQPQTNSSYCLKKN